MSGKLRKHPWSDEQRKAFRAAMDVELDYTDYETYHIIKGDDGKLTVSDIIWWQDLYCANSVLNIQTGKSADEEDIPRRYS